MRQHIWIRTPINCNYSERITAHVLMYKRNSNGIGTRLQSTALDSGLSRCEFKPNNTRNNQRNTQQPPKARSFTKQQYSQ